MGRVSRVVGPGSRIQTKSYRGEELERALARHREIVCSGRVRSVVPIGGSATLCGDLRVLRVVMGCFAIHDVIRWRLYGGCM